MGRILSTPNRIIDLSHQQIPRSYRVLLALPPSWFFFALWRYYFYVAVLLSLLIPSWCDWFSLFLFIFFLYWLFFFDRLQIRWNKTVASCWAKQFFSIFNFFFRSSFFFQIAIFIYSFASLLYYHCSYFPGFFFSTITKSFAFFCTPSGRYSSAVVCRPCHCYSMSLMFIIYLVFFCIWPFIVVAGACIWLLYYRGHYWTFVWLLFAGFWLEVFRFYPSLFAVLSSSPLRFYLSIA